MPANSSGRIAMIDKSHITQTAAQTTAIAATSVTYSA
jgi:hypothetical protein